MHFQHHAKPNCFRKDPDINMHPFFFALGKVLSVEVSRGISLGAQKPASTVGFRGSAHRAGLCGKTLWAGLAGRLFGSRGRP